MDILSDVFTDLPLLLGAAEGGETGGSGGLLTMLLPFALIILVFYFLIIRPQSKKQKETKSMLSSLQKNDRIATIGGIRGTIVTVKDDTVIVRVDGSVKMEFSKSAISAVIERKDGPKPSKTTKEAVEPKIEEKAEEQTEDSEDDSE